MISVTDFVSEAEAETANDIADELREVVDGHPSDLAIAALSAVLLGTVLTLTDGDVEEAMSTIRGLAEDLVETVEQSEAQIAALRQGGPN